MTFEWKIFARDPADSLAGEVEEYSEATLMPVYNDVGTWSLTMDLRARQAINLTRPGWGIVVTRNGSVILSGLTTHRLYNVDLDLNKVQVSGVTDEVWLKRRLVSPSPGESVPPYSAQAYDVRTGVASTVLRQYVNVNAGPGAVAPRRVPGLTIGTDPVIGASVSGNGRWDTNLLAFLQPLATAGGVGFRVVRVGNGTQFQVYAPTDRTASVKFSIDLGNLAAFEYESTAPDVNYVYVGASGTGTTRIINEYPDSDAIAAWGRIEGPLVDQRGTSDATQIAQAGTDALTQGSEQASLTITPIETPSLQFGTHYFLGDKVTVQLQGPTTPYAGSGLIKDILRSVTIKLTKDGPQTVTPTVGTAARGDVSRMFRELVGLRKRLNNLERQ